LATTDPPLPPGPRAYRAACPNCGAPVDFRSAASPMAVCSFCRSTLLRDGEALQRIGVSAELFDDHSPLQLGVSGRTQGAGFTLVGRLQMRYAGGTWNEWHALFDSGKSGWLSEDNGQYVLSFEIGTPPDAPPAEALRAGARQVLAGAGWSVSAVTAVKVGAAEGELSFVPNLARGYVVAELRNTQGEVGTLDYGDSPPRWYVGRAVRLDELSLSGLKDESAKAMKGRSLECPSCGAALEAKLGSTQSIVCHQCHAVVDLASTGGDLAAGLKHYEQENGLEPLLPLGSSGQIALGSPKPLPWQVVGYVERRDIPDSDEEESTFWREYLLYHRTEGFAFLVDTEEGWSWVRPLTGVPRDLGGDRVVLDGDTYRRKYRYQARITYVLGEFYWHLERDQPSINTDYEGTGRAAGKQLNREEAGGEVTWSRGEKLDSAVVARAFRLPQAQHAALRRDASPLASQGVDKTKLIVWAVVLLLVMVVLLSQCNRRDDCDQVRNTFGANSNEYRQCLRSAGSGSSSGGSGSRGGSWGGWSSGGGHK
jgi:hypothetical protein